MEIRVKRKKKRLKRRQKKLILLIAALVVTLLAVIGLGIAKAHSEKKNASAKTESAIEKQENWQDATTTPAPTDISGSSLEPTAMPEVTPGDMEVTEVAVEGEELSEEEIKKMEEKLQANSGTTTTPAEVINPGIPYFIRVNRLANCVTIYGKDANGAYTVPIKAMICSVGKNAGSTPVGVFSTYAKYTWRYLFGEQYGQYTTRIVGHILFHSVPYSQPKKNMLKTDYYNNLGIADSMGCIRLTVADAKWIYDNCPLGTTVEIYDDTNPGPLGKPSTVKLDPSGPYAGWDPTDPDPANPWKNQNQKPTLHGVKNIRVECGKSVDLSSHVSATDFCGSKIAVSVSGNVDTNKCGNYTVTYKATDALGHTSTATATISVVDTTAPTIHQSKVVTVDDFTKELETCIKNTLSASDGGKALGASSIVVDMAPLQTAMNNKAYGTVYCNAYAVDANGNRSVVIKVELSYVFVDNEPTITIVESPVIEIELSENATEEEKKQAILDAAITKVKEGTCYEVSDDRTAVSNLEFAFAGKLNSDVITDENEVVVTITVSDEIDNSVAVDVAVVVVCK